LSEAITHAFSMKISLKIFLAACTLSILTACGNNSTSVPTDAATGKSATVVAATPVQMPMAVDAYTPPAATNAANHQRQLLKARDLSAAPVPAEVYLGAPDANKLSSAQAKSKVEDSSIPLIAGIGRNVAQTSNAALTKQLLTWKTTPAGGNVAAINFNSAGAKGLRIGLLVTKLPETATLRFYAKGATQAFEVKGTEVLSNLARNLAAGDTSDAGRTFWSPRIDGAEGIVEIELPAGVSTDNVDISIPTLSHIFLSTSAITDKFATAYTRINQGLTCEIDINCSTPVPAVSNAVAVMDFINPDASNGFCTGTLLNDSITSGIPYVSTANHCISTQTVATTLQTIWFYKSDSCNLTTGNYYFVTTSSTLLFTALNTDGTLLRLDQAPPIGAMYAGWDATTPPALGTVVSGIHHPQIDPQRISNGNIVSYSVIATRSATGYTWSPSDITNSTLVRTTLLTESGSSGSALFKNITGTNPQVIGQLLGGPAAVCGATNYSDYGRFDKSFNAGMSDWLSPRGYVNRFYNTGTGTHFYTINVAEKTYLQTNFPSFSFEGTPFQAETMQKAGLSPVHRFYNLNLGVHFYTISETERAWVVANLPQMRYEGVAWYSNATSVSGTVPLYRFYNRDKGVHFYTVSLAERDSVIANLKQMNNEGIAYYVLP
jgi:lysyl endopeptidase